MKNTFQGGMTMKRLLLVYLSLLICTITGCGGSSSGGAAVDTTAPVVSTFAMPPTATALDVAVTGFEANDNGAPCAGYQITETSTQPLAAGPGWSTTEPTHFTFSSAGTRTAYAWAKDAAGNVSLAKTATVAITLWTSAVLKVSTQGPAAALSGVGVTINLPAGVTVATDSSGVVVPGAVAVSGVAVPSALAQATFTPATAGANASFTVVVASSQAGGFGIGEFVTVTCALGSGPLPSAAEFTLSAFDPSDLFYSRVSGLTGSLQVTFQ
jgi:hypothetical protein